MENLIKKLFDIQFELTMTGAELDEKINRLQCQPGIHEMVQSESRNLILMAANFKYNIKVLNLSATKVQKGVHSSGKDTKDSMAALSNIENLYYNTFKRFVLLIEKLESDPQNKTVEDLVRSIWTRLGETYQLFRKIMLEMECFISDQQTGQSSVN